MEGFGHKRGAGSLEVARSDTWLAEMNDAFDGTAVDGRRKEETFQVGSRYTMGEIYCNFIATSLAISIFIAMSHNLGNINCNVS